MSTSGTVAAALTATVSETPRWGVSPSDAKSKRHHLKDGKGFTNPWDSWTELDPSKLLMALVKYAAPLRTPRIDLDVSDDCVDVDCLAMPIFQTPPLPPFPSRNPSFLPSAGSLNSSELHG